MTHYRTQYDRPRRLVIWGPGEVGGATLRAAHADPRFEIVGVKIYSPHKHGKDAGELVGIGPIGVQATRSKEEILALDADCVIVAPVPTSTLEGLDEDVIDILESGKSVVTTAGYHNVAQPNWHNQARTPMARLRELSRTEGVARTDQERRALKAARVITSLPLPDLVLNAVLARSVDANFPARATPERLLAACRAGDSSLHGTGVHPTFMVERQVVQAARMLSSVSHVRFVEALDFSLAPEGMWGGLELFGFGREPEEINERSLLARAGDFYYGDLTSNVGHALWGAGPDEIRIERSLRAIPAKRDLQVGSTFIGKGRAAAMHMTHRGYLANGRHFFTNEECWYLTPENAYYGDGLPFGGFPSHGGYTFEITGRPTSLRGQISGEFRPGGDNPITTMSANALLDAVGPVCESPPGIIIDDARASYRLLEEVSA